MGDSGNFDIDMLWQVGYLDECPGRWNTRTEIGSVDGIDPGKQFHVLDKDGAADYVVIRSCLLPRV